MIITQDKTSLREILARVSNHPHPSVGKGHFFCSATGGEGRHPEDTCVFVSGGCYLDLTGTITVGKWVMIGSWAILYTHIHPIKGRKPLLLLDEQLSPEQFTTVIPKIIGDDVWINNSIILGKCDKIARGVFIGAGSVVTRPILEEYTIWAGNPACKIGDR